MKMNDTNQEFIDAMNEPYFTKEEIDWIRATFKNNTRGLRIMRKFFLPTFSHDDPIGQINDMWATMGQKLSGMHPQDREVTILAHVKLMEHLRERLQQIRIMAHTKDETPETKKNRLNKDSSQ